jgi:hypothetical protein
MLQRKPDGRAALHQFRLTPSDTHSDQAGHALARGARQETTAEFLALRYKALRPCGETDRLSLAHALLPRLLEKQLGLIIGR